MKKKQPLENQKSSTIHSKRWYNCPFEEQYLPDDRKETKLERKIASATDRSKHKKSNRDKLKKELIELPKEQLRGRVLSISPQGLLVECDKKIILCVLRGIFKKNKNRIKNLITVGDIVHVELSNDDKEGAITYIEERRSILSRADHLSRRKEQLLAANIDQVLITVSIGIPALKPALVDRYIIAAEKGNMEPVIVMNKIDLLTQLSDSQRMIYDTFVITYQSLNIPLLKVSAATGEGLEELQKIMKNKTSVFSGQSGTGKSSLINSISKLQLPIGNVIDKTKKGAHTTTSAQLLPLSFGGWCIDTPGIRSFGLWRIDKDEVEGFFPEILKFSLNCKYPSCLHLQEPKCAVRKAVEEGHISFLRYESYQKLMTDEDWEMPY